MKDSLSAFPHSIERCSLLELLSSFKFSQARDPQNIVYNLLGIAKLYSSPLFSIDYTALSQKVFRRIIVYIIQNSLQLNVLICANSMTAGLLSWVPNWNNEAMNEFVEPFEYWRWAAAPETESSTMYFSGLGTDDAILHNSRRRLINGAFLSVRGIFVAKVNSTFCVKDISTAVELNKGFRELLKFLISNSRMTFCSPTSCGSSVMHVCAQTLPEQTRAYSWRNCPVASWKTFANAVFRAMRNSQTWGASIRGSCRELSNGTVVFSNALCLRDLRHQEDRP